MKTAQKEKVKIYADENIPLEGVKFLRAKLHWDVRYACEEENLREKEDLYHHRRARKEGRVLLTRDRGYLDSQWFPFHRSAGIILLEEKNTEKFIYILSLLSRFIDKILEKNPRYLSSVKLRVSLQGIKVYRKTQGNIKEKFYSWKDLLQFPENSC